MLCDPCEISEISPFLAYLAPPKVGPKWRDWLEKWQPKGENALSARGQFDIAALLEMVGANPPRYGRGKWGCPDCGRPAHVSVDFAKEAFKCWHAGCSFRGYRQTLEKRLGLPQSGQPHLPRP